MTSVTTPTDPAPSPIGSLLTPERAMILEIVITTPGLPLGAIRRQAALGWGSTYHHIDRLLAARLIRTEVDGRRRRVYPMDERIAIHPPASDDGLRLQGARARAAHAVLHAITEEPGIRATQLAAKLRMPPSTVYHNVRRLIHAGLVQRAHRAGAGLHATRVRPESADIHG